ncbi:MAG: FAD-binding oxidoreductase [Alphaproteobacteria bacterium]|nr:FAD-binding oxidoreductase [Alphaproteobacteria bacterium]MBV9370509.1 FAD-binding oxidoreductase [Alphaproteobacteria bacterium]MBV9901410.1 FAD-binding oxidoreductase [Alphaproteobacteria bacterium]
MRADVAIVGAGMAGASLAAELAPHAAVLLLEAEDRPGYHATGRSAAFWSETYGGPFVQPLTTASGAFLRERGFLGHRQGLHLADAAGRAALDAMEAEFGGAVELRRLGRSEIESLVPGLRPECDDGLLEPSCADIDVSGLHAFYLAAARRAGARLETRAPLAGASRHGGRWTIETPAGLFEADLLVDAAGAWADEVARASGVGALGIRPYRRTLVQLRVSPPAPAGMPLVVDALGRFYFKPEAGGRLWLSPHDETACEPCDAAPDELDVATAIDRLERTVDWRVEHVERRWAGLRSFVPDRRPVYGFDPAEPGFFWFAGQGGFGIQTAPAAARLAAALILARDPEIDPAPYRPGRLSAKV